MAFDYFAYASNMAPDVISRLCPRHSYLGVAHLADHRLAFTRRSMKTGTGVADIIQAAREMVWGVLYRIDDNELAAMDRKEGHDWAYKRVTLPVRLGGGPERTAVTYTVRSKEPTQVPPSRQYLDLVIAAARERGLPGPYIEQIEAIRVADNLLQAPRTLQHLNIGSPTPRQCADFAYSVILTVAVRACSRRTANAGSSKLVIESGGTTRNGVAVGCHSHAWRLAMAAPIIHSAPPFRFATPGGDYASSGRSARDSRASSSKMCSAF